MKKNKKHNLKKVAYLREINKEKIKINDKLNNTLTELVKNGENLENYEIWANKKCEIFISPVFIIEKYAKDLEKEGFAADTVYAIVKKESEAGETKNETN